MKKIPRTETARREHMFILLSLAAATCCAALAFYFAAPLKAQEPQRMPDTTNLEQYVLVDLNTADLEALCTLPGVGESRARAILEYREQYGPFEQLSDVTVIPGLTESVANSWDGQAYVS